MFSYIKLKNYKSLTNIFVDFTNKKKDPKKLILIYGENGSGKSNLASAFYMLDETLGTMLTKNKLNMLRNDLDSNKSNDMIIEFIKTNHKDLEMIIKQCKTVSSNENMVLEYGISIDGKNGYYYLEFDDSKVVKEELYFIIEKNKGFHFILSQDELKINPRVFTDLAYNEELKDKIHKFWGKHTFLSILCNELDEKNTEYVENRISHNLIGVINFLNSISINVKKGSHGEYGKYSISYKVLSQLKDGIIPIADEKQLDYMEIFLKGFFTSLYADIKDVYYKKSFGKENIDYTLYCKKAIGDKIRDINFDLESTGTLKLVDSLPCLIMSILGSTTIIDEFDSGIHDLLVKNILKGAYQSIKGQLIITTHNTFLMEGAIPNESLYFIVISSDGGKEILCLNDYEHRTYPQNNIRDLYLKGMYEGIPIMMDIDFEELLTESNF